MPCNGSARRSGSQSPWSWTLHGPLRSHHGCIRFTDPRFSAVNVKLRSTGASRDSGIRAALERLRAAGTASTWLATTDADSTVPEHWLVRQVELANAGADAILGSVEPDPTDVDPAGRGAAGWRSTFREDHSHIYGANLGIRASAYVGGGWFSHAAVPRGPGSWWSGTVGKVSWSHQRTPSGWSPPGGYTPAPPRDSRPIFGPWRRASGSRHRLTGQGASTAAMAVV